jgi:hypothetical protein
LKTIQSEKDKYFYKVKKYGYEGFKCCLYKKLFFIPIKIHEEIFLRTNFNNSEFKMAWSTMWNYEHGLLTD